MMQKPILFNQSMVYALQNGAKTMTRRVVKPQPKAKLAYVCMGHKHGTRSYPDADAWKYWEDESFRLPDRLSDEDKVRRWMPPYHSGDILYVRETWQYGFGGTYLYKANVGLDLFMTADGKLVSDIPWRPSIHMPREAARLFLRVTDVRVERLQEISDADMVQDFGFSEDGLRALGRETIARLVWDSTIKKDVLGCYGWDANPWVWVIAFEQISKEAAYA